MKTSLKLCLRICSTTLLFFLVSIVSLIYAQDGQTIISRIQEKFKSINSIEADFVQHFRTPDGTSTVSLEGTYIQGTDGKFKISTDKGAIISDGQTVWNVDRKMNRVVISSADDRTNSFSLEKIIFEFPDLCEINLEESTAAGYTVKLTPSDNLGFKEAVLDISVDYLIKSVSIEDFNQNFIVFNLDNYKIDQNIDPETFNYTPDEGIEIIDLR